MSSYRFISAPPILLEKKSENSVNNAFKLSGESATPFTILNLWGKILNSDIQFLPNNNEKLSSFIKCNLIFLILSSTIIDIAQGSKFQQLQFLSEHQVETFYVLEKLCKSV